VKINTFNDHKPIQYFLIVLILAVFLGALMCLITINDDLSFYSPFTLLMLIWHAVTAIGMMSKYKWGLYLFKFYLYVLYIGFPIGTYIARKYLSYMENHEIEKCFSS